MDAYRSYKPLRNHIKRLELIDSLGVIRAYLQYFQFGQPLPGDIQVPIQILDKSRKIQNGVYEWMLATLVKEVILNAERSISTEKTLRNWDCFAGVCNKIKQLEEDIAGLYREEYRENVLTELHRIAHRQFPWTHGPDLILLNRYFKIFSFPSLASIVQKKFGLTVEEIYIFGTALVGVYIDKFSLDYPPRIEISGVTREAFEKFLPKFSKTLDEITEMLQNTQVYDYDYAYTFNPLKAFPIIRTQIKGKESLIAPIPLFLFLRFTDGIYFDICNEDDFSKAFGDSFHNYIGCVLEEVNENGALSIIPEEHYSVGKDDKQTADWIISDSSANLFIECKTKRLRAEAKKSLIDKTILHDDLDKFADGVVQIYKTIKDYKQNMYNSFKYDGKKIYPVLVALDEWYAFGDMIIGELNNKIKIKLTQESLPESILEEMPYTVVSAQDFESLVGVIEKRSIEEVMSKKTLGENRLWTMRSFLIEHYREDLLQLKVLFPEEYKKIHPQMSY